MTIFEQTLRQILIDTNLVGKAVFLMQAPQVPTAQLQVPYFVFFPVAAMPTQVHTGPLNVEQTLYQVSTFDKSQTRALAIAYSLKEAIDTLCEERDSWLVGPIFYRTQTWAYEEETKLFHVIQEYTIMYRALGTVTIPAVTTAVSNRRRQPA